MNGQAVVYVNGRPKYLGRHGSPESKIAYSRLVAELQANPSPAFFPQKKESYVTVRGLAVAFLDHAKANFEYTEYSHYRIIVLDFLDKLYGDSTPADSFKPRCLKLVRTEMIQSGYKTWESGRHAVPEPTLTQSVNFSRRKPGHSGNECWITTFTFHATGNFDIAFGLASVYTNHNSFLMRFLTVSSLVMQEPLMCLVQSPHSRILIELPVLSVSLLDCRLVL